ncbi:MAG: phosphoglucosamine mutase, partial [Deltaproteobacteria bacterium]|nr:phosphoglucosamine mutase [Deltaproteobacteria bacterium]
MTEKKQDKQAVQNERKLFGTDGVRGVANEYPMTAETAMQIGRGAAYILKKDSQKRPKIVIGKDTRLSGYMIENAMASGICSMGAEVILAGILPTPGIAFLARNNEADAGIVISASHNQFQDNGIKIFSHDGFKLPDEVEAKIENLIFSNELDYLRPKGAEIGRVKRLNDAAERYIQFLKNTFPEGMALSGLRLVVDAANGAAYKCAPAVFEELGAEVFLIGAEPNGENINRGCGSLHPEAAADMVLEKQADLGLALDGDADRVIFVDHQGQIVDGDHIMAICARDLNHRGLLARKTVVATVMSNLGLKIALNDLGLDLIQTDVGDRYVVERMRQGGYNFGGEQSGHLIFLNHNTTGDGILSALQVLAVMKREEKSLAELAGIMESLPQILVNVRVSKRVDLMDIPKIKHQCRLVQDAMGDEGRLLVRYSGTEPLV